jgi:hypothetical protein
MNGTLTAYECVSARGAAKGFAILRASADFAAPKLWRLDVESFENSLLFSKG